MSGSDPFFEVVKRGERNEGNERKGRAKKRGRNPMAGCYAITRLRNPFSQERDTRRVKRGGELRGRREGSQRKSVLRSKDKKKSKHSKNVNRKL